MADQIIVATLYQHGQENSAKYFLNVRPSVMTVSASDVLYLVVKKHQSVTIGNEGEKFSAELMFTLPAKADPIKLGEHDFEEVFEMFTVLSKPTTGTYSYTLCIDYAEKKFTDDPKMTINPKDPS